MIDLTLALAERAARAAQAQAATLGIAVTVSVVDESGRLVLCMTGDGTGFLTTETSRAKAVAAAAFRTSTLKLAGLQTANPFWAAVPAISHGEALPTGGAAPILQGGKLLGGIGCGGGSPEQDQVCADAGAAALA